jgi:hypothetical protein
MAADRNVAARNLFNPLIKAPACPAAACGKLKLKATASHGASASARRPALAGLKTGKNDLSRAFHRASLKVGRRVFQLLISCLYNVLAALGAIHIAIHTLLLPMMFFQ